MNYTFDKAWELVGDIHECHGDTSFQQYKECLNDSFSTVDISFNEFWFELRQRTDISQDLKWELEDFEDSIKVVFALMGGKLDEN